RIRLMARIFERLSDQGIELFVFHAMLAKLRIQTQTGEEVSDKRNRALVRFSIRAAHYFETAGNPYPPIQSGLSRGAEFHACHQAESVSETMVQTADCGKRMGQGMDNPKVLLEGY